jgi:hypothetical protein
MEVHGPQPQDQRHGRPERHGRDRVEEQQHRAGRVREPFVPPDQDAKRHADQERERHADGDLHQRASEMGQDPPGAEPMDHRIEHPGRRAEERDIEQAGARADLPDQKHEHERQVFDRRITHG